MRERMTTKFRSRGDDRSHPDSFILSHAAAFDALMIRMMNGIKDFDHVWKFYVSWIRRWNGWKEKTQLWWKEWAAVEGREEISLYSSYYRAQREEQEKRLKSNSCTFWMAICDVVCITEDSGWDVRRKRETSKSAWTEQSSSLVLNLISFCLHSSDFQSPFSSTSDWDFLDDNKWFLT